MQLCHLHLLIMSLISQANTTKQDVSLDTWQICSNTRWDFYLKMAETRKNNHSVFVSKPIFVHPRSFSDHAYIKTNDG